MLRKSLFIIVIFCSIAAKAQQKEYTAFLEQALQAIEINDEGNFNSNLKYFSVAIERDKITPEILTEKNLTLYTKCLYKALIKKFKISDELAKQAIQFLEYDLENHPDNYYSLAQLYEGGIGVNEDYAMAIHFYKEAANKANSSLAIARLCLHYLTMADYKQTLYWCERAAEVENVFGMHYLGYLYENGLGVAQDYEKAKYWYEVTCNKGWQSACESYQKIKNK